MSFEEKIKSLNLILPSAPSAIAAYIPAKKNGNIIYTSGQLPLKEGKLIYTGKVGKDLDVQQAKEAMQQSCLNALAAIKALTGSLDSIQSIVKLTAFVASHENFTEQHLVANAASELLFSIFGEIGRHARSAVGLTVLPLNAPVELEMIIEVK
jgi:enamine deaminase RidA (YjgF/YER057c/UK114 family)